VIVLAIVLLARSEIRSIAQIDARDRNPGNPWPATDALGRTVPTQPEAGRTRSDRFVGIFYFLWHNERRHRSPLFRGPYDVGRILAADPEALDKPESRLWGPVGTWHYWGEPLYGYYLSDDRWVLRRHARLLADAGVDTLIFDTTNAETYKDVYMTLCDVFTQVRQHGGRTPQIAFMVHTKAGETAERIYRELYEPGHYRPLWFHWQGKPLLICDPGEASPSLRSFFTLRRAHWPLTMTNTQNAWHWEATYPQPYGYTDDPHKPEQVNVSVAQNLRARDGQVTNMSRLDARGRSFHDGERDLTPGAVSAGLNADEQWRRALELDPPFVMVTGWNEWIATRLNQTKEPLCFVDQFNEEFSRDIEPMKNGHGDNYYYQLVANVRRYKGAPPLPLASAPKTIPIRGAFDSWADVGPEYHDDVGDTLPRNHDGAGGLHYTDRSGRNDLVAFKVARDEQNLYFFARSQGPLSPRSGAGWMWLLLDVDGNCRTGWEGFDYIVHRTIDLDGTAWLERHDGGSRWIKVARVEERIAERELHLAIPRSALGLSVGAGPLSLDFKWADSLQRPGEVMDFYTSGDVAPEGRFRYRYKAP
jgi:hypothetical protein